MNRYQISYLTVGDGRRHSDMLIDADHDGEALANATAVLEGAYGFDQFEVCDVELVEEL